MLPYQVLPMTPEAFEQVLGPLCAIYAEDIYTTMRHLTPAYSGGMYELRHYANGAVMMVLIDERPADAKWGAEGETLKLSSISIAANLIVSEGLCNKLYGQGYEDGALLMQSLHYTQKDALRNYVAHVFSISSPDYQRKPTPEELEMANNTVTLEESAKIFKLLN